MFPQAHGVTSRQKKDEIVSFLELLLDRCPLYSLIPHHLHPLHHIKSLSVCLYTLIYSSGCSSPTFFGKITGAARQSYICLS